MASLDNVQDAVDVLKGAGVYYCLVVGVPGEKFTTVFENLELEKDFDEAVVSVQFVKGKRFK